MFRNICINLMLESLVLKFDYKPIICWILKIFRFFQSVNSDLGPIPPFSSLHVPSTSVCRPD